MIHVASSYRYGSEGNPKSSHDGTWPPLGKLNPPKRSKRSTKNHYKNTAILRLDFTFLFFFGGDIYIYIIYIHMHMYHIYMYVDIDVKKYI
jgi:hypothetical protein